MKSVVILGASTNPDHYAFKAMQRLQEHGYKAIPVNPAFDEVLSERCYPSIAEVPQPIDTITLYLGAARSTPLIQDILKSKPRRIIFNPGAENEDLAKAVSSAGIETVEGCTLVMLGAGTF
jgi:predicted CoA-binding protein